VLQAIGAAGSIGTLRFRQGHWSRNDPGAAYDFLWIGSL